MVILSLTIQYTAKAQDAYIPEKGNPSFVYDEIPVYVILAGYGHFDINVIYTNNDLLFVNIRELLRILKIACFIGQKGDSLGGFIEKESRTYNIDYNRKQIKVRNRIINVKSGLVKEMDQLYMESSLFTEVFGISFSFNYRSLSVILKSNFELPVIKQQRIEKMRNNLSKLKGEVIADTVVGRDYHFFKFGILDWGFGSNQAWNGRIDNRLNIGIGTELFYGEAGVSLNYSDQYKFDINQLNYLWRWVDNDKRLIKQAQVGKISNQTIAFINAPMIGAVVRNAPTSVRRASGFYTINSHTEPNWTVELYINDVLVDYTKADASGLYIFKVPVVYGYTSLKLKFYGPMGEERTEERTMNIPYMIMPTRQLEYGLSAGILQDKQYSRFGKGELNYGVTRFLTLGCGLEYLSSIPQSPFIPYAKVTIQPFSKLIISGEYAYGVRTHGLLNYYLMKNTLLEIDYTRYTKGQQATHLNALEERKAKLSIPFRIKKINGFARLDYSQFVYSEFNYNQGNVVLSAYYKQFSANSSAQLNWIDKRPAYITTELSLSYRIKYGFNLQSSAQYNISRNNFVLFRAAVEKRFPKGYCSVSYERNVLYKSNYISLNFKYDLPFVRTNISAYYSGGIISTSESVQGSLAFGGRNRFIYKNNNSSNGRGGLVIYPFLDLNNNGTFDAGEHMVKLSTVKIMGGNAIYGKKDSIIRIPDLNAFTNYFLEFNDNDLENINWRFKNKTYRVLIDPNQFKRIDIPIYAIAEVSGMVYLNRDNSRKGIGRILVKFYRKNSTKPVVETLSEMDGYISNMGLGPGDYVAMVDSAQLSILDLKAEPQQKEFKIKTVEEGDIVSGIDFVLSAKKLEVKQDTSVIEKDSLIADSLVREIQYVDTIPVITANEKMQNKNLKIEKVSPDINSENQLPENVNIPVWGDICTQAGSYYVMSISFKYKFNAIKLAMYIKQNTGVLVGVVYNKGLYKVQIGCVSQRSEADKINNMLIEKKVWDNIIKNR